MQDEKSAKRYYINFFAIFYLKIKIIIYFDLHLKPIKKSLCNKGFCGQSL